MAIERYLLPYKGANNKPEILSTKTKKTKSTSLVFRSPATDSYSDKKEIFTVEWHRELSQTRMISLSLFFYIDSGSNQLFSLQNRPFSCWPFSIRSSCCSLIRPRCGASECFAFNSRVYPIIGFHKTFFDIDIRYFPRSFWIEGNNDRLDIIVAKLEWYIFGMFLCALDINANLVDDKILDLVCVQMIVKTNLFFACSIWSSGSVGSDVKLKINSDELFVKCCVSVLS